jgi:hypothetical protein
MPQIIMMQHAAWINKKRLDAAVESRRAKGEQTFTDNVAEMPLFNGKPIDQLTTEEYMAYQAMPI